MKLGVKKAWDGNASARRAIASLNNMNPEYNIKLLQLGKTGSNNEGRDANYTKLIDLYRDSKIPDG